MDPTERALLDAIIAHPDDDTPRLVYADWLDEHDRGPRAEFIRAQCARAALRYGSPEYLGVTSGSRAFELRKAHEHEWVAELGLPANRNTSFWFRRGMVAAVWCNTRYFLNNHTALMRAAPIECVTFRKLAANNLREVKTCESLPAVRGVEFLIDETSPEFAREYLRAVSTGALRAMTLKVHCVNLLLPTWTTRNVELARTIAATAGLCRLERLELRNAGIGEDGARALIASPFLQNLKFLQVEDNGIGEVVERELRDRFGNAVVLGQSDYPRFTLGELGWW